MIVVKIPTVGESITEVSLLKWNKQNGDYVKRDEVLAELESEKATFELNAEKAGILTTKVNEGDVLKIGDVVAEIDETAQAPINSSSVPEATLKTQPDTNSVSKIETIITNTESNTGNTIKITPVAAQIVTQVKADVSKIHATGVNGKIQKTDVLNSLQENLKKASVNEAFSRQANRQKLTQLRKVIARRLVESKNTTAMLTTFNEVDMSAIMEIRKTYKETFKKQHDVNLGFMSFFTKACCIALKEISSVNAYIDGDEIVTHDYADISIAVSAPRGLVVPVIRNAESLGMADIEKKVVELATKARDNKLTMEEMTGGTFTITNGGVFGSLMSTPIINLPQSAILGMHKIQERPIAQNGQVVIKPMMYIALSYDHRIIDGRESVTFLVRVKELLENPTLLFTLKDPIKYLLEL